MARPLNYRLPGTVPYEDCLQDMKAFVAGRTDKTCDEIWFVEHPPVFTQGMAGKPEHILDAGNIPIIQTDRGGQVTYHGPGQIVAYVLLDLSRRRLGVRRLVELLEEAVIHLLADYNIRARGSRTAPGVYVEDAKIASLGLRVRRGCSYHGLSLNVDVDLEPFHRINPCGHRGLQVINMRTLDVTESTDNIRTGLYYHLCTTLNYRHHIEIHAA